jgi:hypothetical protein
MNTAFTMQYQSAYTPGTGPLPGAANGSDGKIVDVGYLLNIVAGPDLIVNNPQIGNYQIDGAATYAGRVVSLAPQSGTTNKTLPSVLGLAFNYGASIQNTLVGNNFVIFNSVNGSFRTVADQTYSLPNLDFTKLSTLRTTYAAMEAVRTATQQYIGEPSNPATLNAMGTTINTALTNLQNSGALLDFSYNINATTADQIAGNLRITLGLVPALQIRKIYVTISLSPGATITATSSQGNPT